MPRASGASYRGNEGRDTIRNMVTTAFMMNGSKGRASSVRGDKPFSDNQNTFLKQSFRTALTGFKHLR